MFILAQKINIDYHINDILDLQQQEEISEYILHEANNDSIDKDDINYDTIENVVKWHHKVPTKEEFEKAINELNNEEKIING